MEKHIIKQVAKMLNEDPAIVTSIIDHYELFIADTIRSGTMENVRVPNFGQFHVNLKKIRQVTQKKTSPETIVVMPQSRTL